MLTCLVASSHGVVLVIHKVMVEMDVVWPLLSVVGKANLCSIVDMASDGAVVDHVPIGRVERALWMEGLVD